MKLKIVCGLGLLIFPVLLNTNLYSNIWYEYIAHELIFDTHGRYCDELKSSLATNTSDNIEIAKSEGQKVSSKWYHHWLLPGLTFSNLPQSVSSPLFSLSTFSTALLVYNNKTLFNTFDTQLRNDAITTSMPHITYMGDGTMNLSIAALMYFFGKEKEKLAAKMITESFFLSGIQVQELKVIAGENRPFKPDHLGVFDTANNKSDSFPSGHTSNAFSLATVLSGVYGKPWLFYSLATLVGISRIYVHSHWPADVLAGALIGYSAGKHSLKIHGYETKNNCVLDDWKFRSRWEFGSSEYLIFNWDNYKTSEPKGVLLFDTVLSKNWVNLFDTKIYFSVLKQVSEYNPEFINNTSVLTYFNNSYNISPKSSANFNLTLNENLFFSNHNVRLLNLQCSYSIKLNDNYSFSVATEYEDKTSADNIYLNIKTGNLSTSINYDSKKLDLFLNIQFIPMQNTVFDQHLTISGKILYNIWNGCYVSLYDKFRSFYFAKDVNYIHDPANTFVFDLKQYVNKNCYFGLIYEIFYHKYPFLQLQIYPYYEIETNYTSGIKFGIEF